MATRVSRTSTLGSLTTWTWSGWVKRGKVSSGSHTLFASITDANNYTQCYIDSGDDFRFLNYVSSSTTGALTTDRKFRDPGAWYHIVVNWDSSNASAGDRIRLYVNGVEETSFSTDTQPGSSDPSDMNKSGAVTSMGGHTLASEDFYGELSHCHFIDGTIYGPTTFGETDSTSGIWKIKTSPSVTYGTNGWFLKFEDRTNLDLDSGTNAFTFTTTGTLTATYDSPSNNFATLNPLDGAITSSGGLLNGNTTYNKTSTGSGYNTTCLSTLGVSAGKWYWECKATDVATTDCVLGFISTAHGPYDAHNQLFNLSTTPNAYGYRNNGTKYVGNVQTTSFFNTFVDDDIISFAIDLDNGKCYAAKNGTWENSGDPTSGATGTGSFSDITDLTQFYVPVASNYNYTDATKVDFNYGNGYFGTTLITSPEEDDAGIGAFKYDVPTGYYAICTKNIKAYGG